MTDVMSHQSPIIDWDQMRDTIKQRLKLGDDWTWVWTEREGPKGYWSFSFGEDGTPYEYELAIEPGFFGYVEVAIYDKSQRLMTERKLRLVLP